MLVLLAVAARAGAQTPPPSTTPPASPPPFVNRANDALPDWLRVRGELRERVEGATGIGFADGREDGYWLSRLRLETTIAPHPVLSFNVQVQDARVADKDIGSTASPFRGPFDVRAAYAELGARGAQFSGRIGRQELAFGEQRLLGHLNWTNTARTFDAGRLTWRRNGVQVDAFAASVVTIRQDELDRSGSGNRLVGSYGSLTRLVPKQTVEPYVIWRRDRDVRSEPGPLGTLHQTTVGFRWNGRLPWRFDHGVEMALQRGSVGSDSVDAWAGHWLLRKTLGGPAALRVIGEYNLASGDKDPTDGTRQTFDQLYPTGHDKYGLADLVGWRNIRHARTGVELTLLRTLQVTTSYHSWWLAERGDALYAASGAVVTRAAGGAAGSHVGQEVDVQLARPLTNQLQVSGGYAYLFPGAYLKAATPGHGYGYPYVMVTYVVLAER